MSINGLSKLCDSEKIRDSIIRVGLGIVLEQADTDPPVSVGTDAERTRFLVTRRRDDALFGGYWEFPGGKIEPDESIEDCVKREVREEVGVNVEVIHTMSPVTHTYPHGTVRLHPRVCRRTDASQMPTPIEVAEVRWCAIQDFASLQFLPANESIVAAIADRLKTGFTSQ